MPLFNVIRPLYPIKILKIARIITAIGILFHFHYSPSINLKSAFGFKKLFFDSIKRQLYKDTSVFIPGISSNLTTIFFLLLLLSQFNNNHVHAQSDSRAETEPTVLVNVGLIGPKSLPSEQLSTMANQQLHALNLTQRDIFHISVKSLDTDGTCPFGQDSTDGSAQTLNLIYTTNISALFGPICADDITLVGRVATSLDVVQFNFWREYKANISSNINGLNTILQMSTMSSTNLATNIAAMLSIFNWRKIALVTCAQCFNGMDGYGIGVNVKKRLMDLNIEILEHVQINPKNNTDTDTTYVNALAEQMQVLKTNSRVILAILGNHLTDYVPFLKALHQLGINTNEYTSILSIARYTPKSIELPWVLNETDGSVKLDSAMLSLFEKSLIVTNDFYKNDQVLSFSDQIGLNLPDTLTEENDVRLLQAIQLYECFWAYALVLWQAYQKTMDLNVHRNGTLLRNLMAGQTIQGPFGPITMNSQLKRLAPYRVFYIRQNNSTIRTDTVQMRNIVNISLVNDCSIANSVFVTAQKGEDGSCIGLLADLLPNNQQLLESFPLDVPSCGFNGELCNQKGTIIVLVSVIIAISLGFIVFLCFRKVKRGETTQMPYYIPEQMISFVDVNGYGGSSSMSMHSLNQQPELPVNQNANNTESIAADNINNNQMNNQMNLNGTNAIQSRHIGTVERGFVLIECYRLKEKLSFDKRDMQLLFQMKQMVHDNINPFIGVCVERPTELMIIWRHCFRGNLADLLFVNRNEINRIGASVVSLTSNDDGVGTSGNGRNQRDILDINFKSAFVRDIVKGLDFIHSSNIGYHGALTASRCLIDSHWILKLSGFGTSRLLYKWRHNGTLSSGDGAVIQPLIPNNELHYYSPEARSAIRAAVLRNKTEELEFSNEDGQAQDMYAFGAILYEILYRQKIVNMDDTSEGLVSAENTGIEALEDDVGIYSAVAEERLPIFPEFPGEDGRTSKEGNGSVDRVHPDLVALMRKCFGRVDQRPDANMARKITDATLKMPGSLVDNFLKNMEQYTNNLENLVREQTGRLEEEQQKAEQILLELLPKSVVDELRLGRRVEPQFYGSVTIMYSDIVGFTSLCSESSPIEVVNLLNGMFRAFDEAISVHQAYKVETIGDAYMVASGVPLRMEHHVREIASISLMQRDFLRYYEIPHRPGQFLHCRWGFNSGNVFTGVVGITAPRYCVFGTTVTLAAKMENSGIPDRIQMTLKSYQLLSDQFPEFRSIPRGGVRIEGIGTLLTYWLDGLDNDDNLSGRTNESDVIQQVIPRSPILTAPSPSAIFPI